MPKGSKTSEESMRTSVRGNVCVSRKKRFALIGFPITDSNALHFIRCLIDFHNKANKTRTDRAAYGKLFFRDEAEATLGVSPWRVTWLKETVSSFGQTVPPGKAGEGGGGGDRRLRRRVALGVLEVARAAYAGRVDADQRLPAVIRS